MYLEPIYTQEDVVANLIEQRKVFERVNNKFKQTMMPYVNHRFVSVNDFCKLEQFLAMQTQMIKDLEFLDKSLAAYLDKKRAQFARLYFTSNDELIGLMANLKDQLYVQVFLSKLFDGIAGLIFDKEFITGFYSRSNEQVFFKETVSTQMPPEMWIAEVEVKMKKTLYEQL